MSPDEADTRRAAIWSVTSGKGGVGKTTLSLNLGIALSRLGRQVLLIDADLGLANVNILLGASPDLTLEDLLRGRATAFDVTLPGPEGLTVLPAATGLAESDAWRSEDRERLADELGRLERGFDVILIDTGAGISAKVTDFVLSSDKMLVVAVPEPTSIADAYAMVKVCSSQRQDLDLGLVVNRARSPREAYELREKFEQILGRFLGLDLSFGGHVLEDLSVERAARDQQPLLLSQPKAQAALCIEKLARDLAPDSVDLKVDAPGLFDRLMDRSALSTGV